jgi:DNA-binding GntR family transcriptional regulator
MSMFHVLDRLPRFRNNAATLDERWEARHADFHAALLSACGSKILTEFCRSLYERADRYRRFSISVEAGARDVNAEHRAILDAALARDAQRACALLAEHYRNTAMLVRRHFEAQGRSQTQPA